MKQQSQYGLIYESKNHSLSPQDGFSSDQTDGEIIYQFQNNFQNQSEQLNEQNNKIKLQVGPLRDIVTGNYSLEPDMLSGWTPKTALSRPIPLTFRYFDFDCMIDYALKYKKINGMLQGQMENKILLCYMGARYQTTYYAWYDKQFPFPYAHLNAPKNIKITDRFLVGQHWTAEREDILNFDSIFQSGNLDCVLKVGDNQYDCFLRVDSNSKGHFQWYNFKVRNMKKMVKYKINICNMQKGKSLYTRGMRPYCYSHKKFQREKMGWFQIEGLVKYRKKMSKTEKILQNEQVMNNYMLSFEIQTQYDHDEFQLAYCIPYTYSKLKKYLNTLQNNENFKDFVDFGKLCNSLGGHVVDELTVTQNVQQQLKAYKNKQRLEKKIIFITGRCHPGETNGSWMVEGLIDYLCGNSQSAKILRKNFIFKIIPMLNPDGVIIGNYRTGLFGKDFNREFQYPDKDIFPQIYNLKQIIWNYKQIYQENVLFYLDFHGHSVKKNVFAYGPQYSISHKNYYQSKMIAKLIALKTKMFRYHSCIFKICQAKQTTGRAIFLNNFKIPFTFTIQASNGCYFDQQKMQNVDFNEEKWKQVGSKILDGIYEYMKLLREIQKIREQKMRERQEIIIRNRQRNKIKRSKNTKMVDSTNGFKKLRIGIDNNQQKEGDKKQKINIFFDDLMTGMRNMSGGEKFEQFFEEIQGEQKKIQRVDIQSDDNISEGSSDSQKSKEDLDDTELKCLYVYIKNKKGKNRLKIGKGFGKNIENPARKVQTMYESELKGDDNDMKEDQIQDEIIKINEKNTLNKRMIWKKKSSLFSGSSVSPNKREQNNLSVNTAKIVSFNFSLNPKQCTIISKNNQQTNILPYQSSTSTNAQMSQGFLNHKLNAFSSTNYTKLGNEKMDQKDIRIGNNDKINVNMSQGLKKFGVKQVEYSQNFKKTFLSVQKEMLRRDSYKRYLVSMNNSQNQNKAKPNYIIENGNGISNGKGKARMYGKEEKEEEEKEKEKEKEKEDVSNFLQRQIHSFSPIKNKFGGMKNKRKGQRSISILQKKVDKI